MCGKKAESNNVMCSREAESNVHELKLHYRWL